MESSDPGTAALSPEAVVRTCPNCGHSLEERGCELFCPTEGCGYTLSCSDYY